METNTWTYYINGASRIAKVIAELEQQPVNNEETDMELHHASYYITDHLGNTRVVYDATVDCPTIFYDLEYAADYYPYGKALREFTNGKVERYLTTPARWSLA